MNRKLLVQCGQREQAGDRAGPGDQGQTLPLGRERLPSRDESPEAGGVDESDGGQIHDHRRAAARFRDGAFHIGGHREVDLSGNGHKADGSPEFDRNTGIRHESAPETEGARTDAGPEHAAVVYVPIMVRFSDMPVCVSVPARPGTLAVLRSMVLGAGADIDLSVDALDDMALAVHESAVHLIGSGATRLELGLGPDDAGLRVALGGDMAVDPWPPPGWSDTLAGRVVSALVDHVDHFTDHDGSVVALTRRAPAA